jgi:hypothetical protein
MDFDKALNDLPDVAGFDSFEHKTIQDLCWLCLHELDLHAEQEYWHPTSVRKKLLSFCKKYGHYYDEAKKQFDLGSGLRKADANM